MPLGVLLPSCVTAADLAAEHGGEIDPGCEGRLVRRVVSPEDATADDDLVVVASARKLAALAAKPGLVLVDQSVVHRVPAGRRWVHPHAMWVVARLLSPLLPRDERTGPAPGARVDPGADVHPTAVIRPGAVVLRGAVVGEGSTIGENAVVYGGARIGARVVVGPLTVIGRQGFGFATGPGGAVERIAQLGGVLIEDDVELGALVTVDAGTLGPTVIRRGAKLDAHVHVGHNVEIGEGTFVAAQAGFAGSSRIGRGVLVGGQAGVKDHAQIGDGARIGGKSGVIGDVAPGDVVAGFPAITKSRWLRAWGALLRQKRKTR